MMWLSWKQPLEIDAEDFWGGERGEAEPGWARVAEACEKLSRQLGDAESSSNPGRLNSRELLQRELETRELETTLTASVDRDWAPTRRGGGHV